MEHYEERLKILSDSSAFAEKALRQIIARLREGRSVTSHEEHLLRESIKDCENILAMCERERKKLARPSFAKRNVPPNSINSPVRQRLAQLRSEFHELHASQAPRDCIALLESWEKFVDLKMSEFELAWAQKASDQLNMKRAEWYNVQRRGIQPGFGLLAKFRAYRTASSVRDLQSEIALCEVRLERGRKELAIETRAARIMAGVAAVHFKIRQHASKCEHRVVRKVLEWDDEQEIASRLVKSAKALELELSNTKKAIESMKDGLMDSIGEHALLEERKQEILNQNSERECRDVPRRIVNYTGKQIVKGYEALHEMLDEQLADISRDKVTKQKIQFEFERLMGVVHEYQQETSEQERIDGSGEKAAVRHQGKTGVFAGVLRN